MASEYIYAEQGEPLAERATAVVGDPPGRVLSDEEASSLGLAPNAG